MSQGEKELSTQQEPSLQLGTRSVWIALAPEALVAILPCCWSPRYLSPSSDIWAKKSLVGTPLSTDGEKTAARGRTRIWIQFLIQLVAGQSTDMKS